MSDPFKELESLDSSKKSSGSFKDLENLDSLPETRISAASQGNADLSPQSLLRSGKLLGRAAVQGVAALPLMAMDAGVAVRNLYHRFRGEDEYEYPSHMFNQALNEVGVPEPQGKTEKIGSFVVSTVAGSKMPSPQAAQQAPAGFVRPTANPMQATLKAAQKEGYVVPPATSNQSMVNRLAEGAAGKLTTAQSAAIKNQEVTNELARRALGMSEDVPITPESLRDLRSVAGKVYAQIANSGEIKADAQYIDDLVKLGKSADEISQSFPEANVGASKQITQLADSLLQDKFSAKSALAYLKELRNQAKGNLSPLAAADPAKQALGMAQREAASTLEDLIQRHLTANGQEELATSFQQARKLIAVSHTVEKALNESTGNVVAKKLGDALAKGKPLSDELETIAKFARAFPKAAKEVTESMPGVSPLDFYGAGGVSAVAGNLWPMLYPAFRMGIRSALLSPLGQKLATEGGEAIGPASATMGLAPSALMQAGSQAVR